MRRKKRRKKRRKNRRSKEGEKKEKGKGRERDEKWGRARLMSVLRAGDRLRNGVEHYTIKTHITIVNYYLTSTYTYGGFL